MSSSSKLSPVEWLNSRGTVVKPNTIRACMKQQDLNKAIKRERNPLRTIKEVVAEIPNAKVFSVVDVNQGRSACSIHRFGGIPSRYCCSESRPLQSFFS